MIEKPMIIKKQEFMENVVNLVNQSGLPHFVMEPILQDVLNAVHIGIEQEYQTAKSEYEAALKKEEQDKSEVK